MAGNQYDDLLEQLDEQKPAAASPVEPKPTPYDLLLIEQDKQQEQAMRASQLSTSATPDKARDILTLSNRTGIPAEVVERNYADIQQRAKVADTPYSRLQQETPALASWLQQPYRAAAASDDLNALGALERTLAFGRNLVGSLGAGFFGDFSQGVWGQIQWAADHMGSVPAGARVPGNVDLRAQPKVKNADGTISTVDSVSVNIDGQEVLLPRVTPDGRHLTTDEAVTEYEKTGRHLGIFDTPEEATRYAQQLHQDYAAGVYDRPENGLASFAAGAAAAAKVLGDKLAGNQQGAGVVESGIYSGMRSVGMMAPGLVASILSEGSAAPSLVAAGAGQFGQSYTQARAEGLDSGLASLHAGLQGAIEVATEYVPTHLLLGDLAKKSGLVKTLLHQVASEVPGEEIATALQDLNEWAFLPSNKDKTLSDYLNERPAAFVATLVSVVASIGATTAMARTTQHFVDKLGEAASQSKTVKTAPELAQEFLERAAKDSPTQTLYQPIESWTKYWQDQGVDPREKATEVTGDAHAYDEAVATGADLPIPTARYAVKIAPTEHNAFFARELRLSPELMNVRETEQLAKDQEAARESTEPAPAEDAAAAERRAQIVEQLVSAGLPRSTAEHNARLYDFQALTERSGINPSTLAELRIVRPELAALSAPAEGRTTLAQVDTSSEAFRDWFGDSVVVDDEGAPRAAYHGTASDFDAFDVEKAGSGRGVASERALFFSTTPETANISAETMGAVQGVANDESFDEFQNTAGAPIPGIGGVVYPVFLKLENPYVSHMETYDPEEMTREIAKAKAEGHDGILFPDLQQHGERDTVAVFSPEQVKSAIANQGTFDPRDSRMLFQSEGGAAAPVATLTGQELGADLELPALREAALTYYDRELRGRLKSVERPGFGAVAFTRKGKKKLGTTGMKALKLQLVPAIPDIIRQGELVRSGEAEKARRDGAVRFHYFEASVSLGGRLVRAGVTVLEDAAGHKFYNLNEEPAALAQKKQARGDLTSRGQGPEPGEDGGDTTLNQSIGDTDDGINLTILGQDDRRRGYISFGPDRKFEIGLLPKANLSTFLHETGHFYLELLGDLAGELRRLDASSLSDTQRRLLADYDDVLKWLGVESREAIATAHHEQFARGFEAYLMEGRAPSVALREAFARFRAWLVGIYRTLRGLNVTLTDEVRGVFDRMLATDQEIADAQRAAHVAPLFTTADAAGVSDDAFARYRDEVETTSRVAHEQLELQLMAEVQREHETQWKARRAEIRAQVEQEVYAQPEVRALAAIRRGTTPDGAPLVEGDTPQPLKLDKQAIVTAYGPERLKGLSFLYVNEGGVDPGLVADIFGFSSVDEMLTALEQAGSTRNRIERETDRRMQAEHGNLLLDGTVHERARAAVMNESRDTVVRPELSILDKLRRFVGRRVAAATPPAAAIRQMAEAQLARVKVRELAPSRYWTAARQASRAATQAAAEQKFDAAIAAKQRELVNLELYRQATKIRDDVAARVKRAVDTGKTASLQRLGRAGPSYVEQVRGILGQYEFVQVPLAELDRRASIRNWVESLKEDGLPADLPEEVLNAALRLNYRDMTVEQLVGVTDGLQQIVHLARLKNRLLHAKDRREYVEVRDRLVESIRAKTAARPTPLEFQAREKRARSISAIFAAHTNIATFARLMDGGIDGGPMWEAIIRPLNEAADLEMERRSQAAKAFLAIRDKYYAAREQAGFSTKLKIDAINGSLSKEARLAVALNWGNQTSRDRLTSDPSRRWTESQVLAILDTLDERDWRFVQDVWDQLDSYWPDIAAKQERVTGIRPEKVEPLPVRTKFGDVRGGYYPLVYDGRLVARAQGYERATAAKLQEAAAYVRTTTKRGHVETRQENVHLSVKLELGVIGAHLDQVIHDLTHHETLIDVTRLLRDPQVAAAILETQGDPAYRQFTLAMEDIARGGVKPGDGGMDRAATWMRSRAQIAGLAWNFWTALQQPIGLFNGASQVGPKWVARGAVRWLANAVSMQRTTQWIAEVSPFMRHRHETATADLMDLHEAYARPGGWFDAMVRRVSADHLTQQAILDSFTWHIGLAQRVADIPTWLGAYEKAKAGGNDEARAIALADQAVIDSQGSGHVKDLSQVQRGSAVARLFLTFYSYGATIFNRTREKAQLTRWSSPASVGTFLGHMALLYVMPALVSTALRRVVRGAPDDDDWEQYLTDVGRETLSTALNTMEFVRELQPLVGEGVRGYEGPAGMRTIQTLLRFGDELKQGKVDDGLKRAMLAAAGVLFAFPAAQVQRTVDGYVALEEGRTENPMALVFGAPPKEGRR
jgi:hypothetical protein